MQIRHVIKILKVNNWALNIYIFPQISEWHIWYLEKENGVLRIRTVVNLTARVYMMTDPLVSQGTLTVS